MTRHQRVKRMVGRRIREECACGGQWPCTRESINQDATARDLAKMKLAWLSARRRAEMATQASAAAKADALDELAEHLYENGYAGSTVVAYIQGCATRARSGAGQ